MLETIQSRRHSILQTKESIYQLIEDSYVGGIQYIDSTKKYLHQNPKEHSTAYVNRQKRAIYFNYLAPLVDLLVGFIFRSDPPRPKAEQFQYLLDNASCGKTLTSFMRIVAAYSLMFPCGVLVDVPEFDSELIKSVADRITARINPYCLLYKPARVRDFCTDDFGNLRWILLDNTYTDKTDPQIKEKIIKRYRLWDTQSFVDYEMIEGIWKEIDNKIHGLGFVPFRFVNWKDTDSDLIGESICEDLALINQAIFNNTSYLDEMISAGSFRMMAYQSEDGEVPVELTMGGIGNLTICPYKEGTQTPSFIGADLQNITPFLEAMTFYIAQMLRKVGVDTDQEKSFVQSGIAKQLDFEKVKTLLSAGAQSLQECEKWIFATAAAWEKRQSDVDVTYTQDFQSEDIDLKLQRFAQLAQLPYETLKKKAHAQMVQIALKDDIKAEDMAEILKEIENYVNPTVDVSDLAEQENTNRNDIILNDDLQNQYQESRSEK